MADSTIDSELFILTDLWPGSPDQRLGVPVDGFTGASHHNVAAAVYPVGTKIQVYNTGVTAGKHGWSTFIYLKLEMQDVTNLLAAKNVVALHSDGGAGEPYDVTNEVATILTTQVGPIAIGLSAMTVDYFGWFWCGGVCPEEFVAALAGDYATTSAVAVGNMSWGNLASPGTTYGELGFDVYNATGETIIGQALHADA